MMMMMISVYTTEDQVLTAPIPLLRPHFMVEVLNRYNKVRAYTLDLRAPLHLVRSGGQRACLMDLARDEWKSTILRFGGFGGLEINNACHSTD